MDQNNGQPGSGTNTNTILIVIVLVIIVALGAWWFAGRDADTGDTEDDGTQIDLDLGTGAEDDGATDAE